MELTLVDLDRDQVVVQFESDDPSVGKFLIGPAARGVGRRVPYVTTDEVRDWWAKGANREDFLVAIRMKKAFPGGLRYWFGGVPPVQEKPAPAKAARKDPVQKTLEDWF